MGIISTTTEAEKQDFSNITIEILDMEPAMVFRALIINSQLDS
jgi:hypothetical protein